MLRWTMLTALVVWMCAGCGPRSMVDAEEDVVLDGRFVDEDGSSLEERVSLIREPSASEVVAVVATLPAWGLYCAAQLIEEDDCLVFRYAEPDADGRYRFELTGQETQKELGVARRLWIGVYDAGVSATVSFYAQASRVELPEVALWRATPTLEVIGDDLEARWEPASLSPGDGAADGYRVQAWAEEGGVIWNAHTTDTSLAVPLDAMQDVGATVRVAAESERPGPDTAFTITQYGPSAAATPGSRTPLSRGASCTYQSSRGTEESLAPCPLTDGRFDDYYRNSESVCDPDDETGGCEGEAWRQVEIDLGAAAVASRLVFHDLGVGAEGVAEGNTVSVSADGVVWTDLGEPQAFSVVSSTATFRYVRLRSDGQASLRAPNELSAY